MKGVAGKKVTEVIPGIRQADPELFEAYGRVARTGRPERFEVFVKALDMWFAVSVYGPEPEHFVAVFDVITERKRSEAALQESEERFRTMANAISQLAWIAKADGFIFWYNQRWYDYTGTTPEQMEGWGWQSVHDPKVLPSVMENWKGAIAAGLPFEMEFPLRGADGRFRNFLTRGQPLKDSAGRVVQWFGTNTDVDELRRAQEEIRLLNVELEQRVSERTAELRAANRELDAFAYAVSHDLRAPLRAMIGFSHALLEDHGAALPSEGHGHLDEIILGSRRMSELIDGLLRLSRSTRGELRRDAVDLSALATRILGELAAAEPNRRVTSTVEPGLSARGDERMIEVVLFNLLGNAWKYTATTPQPKIEVGQIVGPLPSAGVIPSAASGDAAYNGAFFFVRDNGAGFDMRHAARLFQPFQRLHREDEFPGIGIGLATVQRIVQRHGGAIRATALPGQGATFCFSLSASDGNGEEEL